MSDELEYDVMGVPYGPDNPKEPGDGVYNEKGNRLYEVEEEVEKELTEKEQGVHDKMLDEGFSEDSIETFFEDYKDGYESAMKELIEANPDVTERKKAERKTENEREYDAYGIPYDDDLNPKRPEDLVHDKNGKLKDEGDAIDYEKMLKGESAEKTAEGEGGLDLNAIYPEMQKEEDRKNSEEEFPSMKDLPDKRDDTGIPATEEEKKFLEEEYPETKDVPDRQ